MQAGLAQTQFHFLNPFSDIYVRVNKRTKKKNLRCFPTCCPKGHLNNGFCGTPIFVKVDNLYIPAGSDILVFAEFDLFSNSGRFQPGTFYSLENEVKVFERSKESKFNPLIKAFIIHNQDEINELLLSFLHQKPNVVDMNKIDKDDENTSHVDDENASNSSLASNNHGSSSSNNHGNSKLSAKTSHGMSDFDDHHHPNETNDNTGQNNNVNSTNNHSNHQSDMGSSKIFRGFDDSLTRESFVIEVNREKEAWTYSWQANKHTSGFKHCLKVYIFVKKPAIGDDVSGSEPLETYIQCIASLQSPSFRMDCSRNSKSTTPSMIDELQGLGQSSPGYSPSFPSASSSNLPLIYQGSDNSSIAVLNGGLNSLSGKNSKSPVASLKNSMLDSWIPLTKSDDEASGYGFNSSIQVQSPLMPSNSSPQNSKSSSDGRNGGLGDLVVPAKRRRHNNTVF